MVTGAIKWSNLFLNFGFQLHFGSTKSVRAIQSGAAASIPHQFLKITISYNTELPTIEANLSPSINFLKWTATQPQTCLKTRIKTVNVRPQQTFRDSTQDAALTTLTANLRGRTDAGWRGRTTLLHDHLPPRCLGVGPALRYSSRERKKTPR